MSRSLFLSAFIALASFSFPLNASDDPARDINDKGDENNNKKTESAEWIPELEFGYRSKKGNENEQTLNLRLALQYEKGNSRHGGEIEFYLKQEDGETSDRERNYQFQSDYKLTDDVYWYGNFKGIDSNYTSYFHDYTLSSGLGYQFINDNHWLIEAELGPGYRYQTPNTDEIDDDDLILPEDVNEAIMRASLHTQWQIMESMKLDTELTVVSGSSNTRVDTDVGLSYHLNDYVALKLNHSIQHLTRVPQGLSNTDRLFYINLLFSNN